MKSIKEFEVGDIITILSKPEQWSSGAGGKDPLQSHITYPYTTTILYKRSDDIKDCNGYGWSLKVAKWQHGHFKKEFYEIY